MNEIGSNVIGTSVPRTDGASKVTGAALYIDDYSAEGELYGDPVRLARAVKAITLDVEPLPPVLSIDDALAKKENIFGDDNVFKSYVIRHRVDGEHGSIDGILSRCEVVLSGRYDVHHQEQLYI